jgi:transposase-like protein
VKLVISDSHDGIKAAVSKVLKATWQRCRVHFMRNALAHAGKTQRRMVSAAIGTVFVQDQFNRHIAASEAPSPSTLGRGEPVRATC